MENFPKGVEFFRAEVFQGGEFSGRQFFYSGNFPRGDFSVGKLSGGQRLIFRGGVFLEPCEVRPIGIRQV